MASFLTTLVLILGCTGYMYAQSHKKFPQTKVTVTVNVPIDSAFNYIVPIDLTHIFKRYNRLPAIIKTDETEKWIKAGLTRTVYFEDGTKAREKLVTVVPYTSFSYTIEHFSSSLRFLAKRIEGNWHFTDLGNGQTRIDWTYTIIPKNGIARAVIKIMVLRDITGLLNNAITIIKNDLENAD